MKKIIFSDSLLIDYVNTDDYEILKENVFLILEKEQEKSGRYKSNRGGFQTNDLNLNENKEMIKIIINHIFNLIKKNYDFNKIAEHEINTKWNECFSNAYKNIEECIIGKKVNKCDINSALQVHKILDDIKNEK